MRKLDEMLGKGVGGRALRPTSPSFPVEEEGGEGDDYVDDDDDENDDDDDSDDDSDIAIF